jgi:hypothetical protein
MAVKSQVFERFIINELGNEISFEIIADTDQKEVTVFASGPHSEVEHTWTLEEAVTLRDMLIEAIDVCYL